VFADKLSNLSAISWQEQVTLNEKIMMLSLYLTFIVLSHWNNSQQVNMTLYSNAMAWFRANQLVFST